MSASFFVVSLQIIGAHGSDLLTLGVAAVVEKGLGGWRPPAIAGV
jgi:hypothetical protein